MKKGTAGNLEMTREVTRKNNCPAIIRIACCQIDSMSGLDKKKRTDNLSVLIQGNT